MSTKKQSGVFVTPKSLSCPSETLTAYCCDAFVFIIRNAVLVPVALTWPRRFLRHMDDVQSRLKKMDVKKEAADGILKRYKEIGLPNW